MKITKKELFKFCDENNDAINELQSQSDSTDFLLAVLIQQLKDSGVIDEISPEPKPQLKQLDQSVFDGLDAKWRFAAIDLDSEIRAFEQKPVLAMNGTMWDSVAGEEISLGKGVRVIKWYESLIEREDIAKELLEVELSSELTGSELCKAMLARGDKYIKCTTFNNPEIFVFSPHVKPDLITKCWDDGSFCTSDGYSRLYAIPINNQGEPLTAAEVEL